MSTIRTAAFGIGVVIAAAELTGCSFSSNDTIRADLDQKNTNAHQLKDTNVAQSQLLMNRAIQQFDNTGKLVVYRPEAREVILKNLMEKGSWIEITSGGLMQVVQAEKLDPKNPNGYAILYKDKATSDSAVVLGYNLERREWINPWKDSPSKTTVSPSEHWYGGVAMMGDSIIDQATRKP